LIIESKQHKEIVGHVNGTPYHVFFDADGRAEVEDAVGEQLLRIQAVVSVQPTEKSLDDMTVKELKKYAIDNDIELGDASKKEDIIARIKEVKVALGDDGVNNAAATGAEDAPQGGDNA